MLTIVIVITCVSVLICVINLFCDSTALHLTQYYCRYKGLQATIHDIFIGTFFLYNISFFVKLSAKCSNKKLS